MEMLLTWLDTYSPAIAILLAAGAGLLFLFKIAAEKAVEHAFDRHAKALELRLARRSAFEERVLTDRYLAVIDLNTRLNQVTTMINRIRAGQQEPPGFIDRTGAIPELVSLTAIYNDIEAKRIVLTESFYTLLNNQASLVLTAANIGRDQREWEAHAQKVAASQSDIREAARVAFKLDTIAW